MGKLNELLAQSLSSKADVSIPLSVARTSPQRFGVKTLICGRSRMFTLVGSLGQRVLQLEACADDGEPDGEALNPSLAELRFSVEVARKRNNAFPKLT
ncbi:MAG: hypothetical protein ACFB21_09880 [Opitutales bacterium]